MDKPVGPKKTTSFGDFLGKVKEELFGKIAAGILLGAGAVLVLVWGWFQGFAGSQLESLVIAEMNKPDSRIMKIIEAKISKSVPNFETEIGKASINLVRAEIASGFGDKVGDLTAGRFILSENSPAQTIYLYAPEGHKVILHAKIRNLSDGDRIVIIAPNSNNIVMANEGLFQEDITRILSNTPSSATVNRVMNLSPEQGQFRNFYPLRFQLSVAESRGDASTELEYLAVVTPAISVLK
ncbi:hypothetical protein GOL87_28140 [Sinorhizobium medicae]|nr:hypothetical protein [Sinorhizobium medicae]